MRRRAACHGLFGLWVAAASAAGAPAHPTAEPSPLPAQMAWVWDRPHEALAWPPQWGVAYLHSTVRLGADTTQTRRRQWPLRLPPATVAVPVVHVSLDGLRPPVWNAAQQLALQDAVAQAWARSATGWVQVDAEPPASQRSAYAAWLQRLQPWRQQPHAATGRPLRLSITALASWCMQDPWLPAGLVDEIVPMFFHMGRDEAQIREDLARRGQARVAACQSASGGLWGMAHALPPGRHYWFHARTWRAQDLTSISP